MTVYEKHLANMVENRFANLSAGELVEQLVRIGVVDYSRCKVLAVREYVSALVVAGGGKVDSMWVAADKFCCSYEYIRKCMYYYKDVGF